MRQQARPGQEPSKSSAFVPDNTLQNTALVTDLAIDTLPQAVMASQLLPLELIDRCVGSPIRVIMKGDKGKTEAFLQTKNTY